MEKSESYIYEIGKMKFVVEPVYKDKGETIWDILLKLMLAELGLDSPTKTEPVPHFGGPVRCF